MRRAKRVKSVERKKGYRKVQAIVKKVWVGRENSLESQLLGRGVKGASIPEKTMMNSPTGKKGNEAFERTVVDGGRFAKAAPSEGGGYCMSSMKNLTKKKEEGRIDGTSAQAYRRTLLGKERNKSRLRTKKRRSCGRDGETDLHPLEDREGVGSEKGKPQRPRKVSQDASGVAEHANPKWKGAAPIIKLFPRTIKRGTGTNLPCGPVSPTVSRR